MVRIDRNQEKLFLFAFIILVATLLFNLGINPLYHEEPRRALISLEMMYNGDYAVPSQLGEPYYRKPPMFNWVIIGSFKLFGPNEFAARLVTVLSYLVLAFMIFRFTTHYLSRTHGIFSTILFLLSGSLLFYFSVLGEIDIAYALITFSSIISILYFGHTRQWLYMFLVSYFLAGLGFLTKGLPSIAFLGISVLTYLISEKEWKRLFSLKHLAGIVVFLVVTGSWVLMVSREASLTELFNTLLFESSERAKSESGLSGFFLHLITFPASTFVDLLPGSVILVFLTSKDSRSKLWKNPLTRFSILMISFNILVYWIAPESRPRYLFPLHPFFAIIFGALLVDSESRNLQMIFRVLVWLILIIVAGGSIAIHWIPEVNEFGHITPLTIASILIIAFLGLLLYRRPANGFLVLFLALIWARLIFDLTVLESRAENSQSLIKKERGLEIAEITRDEPLSIYKEGRISFITIFYLARERGEVLTWDEDLSPGSHYIINSRYLPESGYQDEMEFDYQGERFHLIRIYSVEPGSK